MFTKIVKIVYAFRERQRERDREKKNFVLPIKRNPCARALAIQCGETIKPRATSGPRSRKYRFPAAGVRLFYDTKEE